VFFFEKKNQKTFVSLRALSFSTRRPAATADEQKFFASFFQKRRISLPFCRLLHRTYFVATLSAFGAKYAL
jgi:hypothetical protein